jgi:hypothetical protein
MINRHISRLLYNNIFKNESTTIINSLNLANQILKKINYNFSTNNMKNPYRKIFIKNY